MLGLSIPFTFKIFSETYHARNWKKVNRNVQVIQSSIHYYIKDNKPISELPIGNLNNPILLNKLKLTPGMFNETPFSIQHYHIFSINKFGDAIIVVKSDESAASRYFSSRLSGSMKMDDLYSVIRGQEVTKMSSCYEK